VCPKCSRQVGVKYVACTAELSALASLYGFEDPTHSGALCYLETVSSYAQELRTCTMKLQEQEERLAVCEDIVEHVYANLISKTRRQLKVD
jgi:hypothetical protein